MTQFLEPLELSQLISVTPQPEWHQMDFVADFHLNPVRPITAQVWSNYLLNTPAQAVFLLGDIFDAWVGDDLALKHDHPFYKSLIDTLLQAARQKKIFFIHGNRDFLVGKDFITATKMTTLSDPSILTLGQQRWLLTHGDALCTDDISYMRFRRKVRQVQWQQKMLRLPLFIRKLIAKFLRYNSKKKQLNQPLTDVNNAAALSWLKQADCQVLLHGHTHHPGEIALENDLKRIILSDWEFDEQAPHGQIFRLSKDQDGSWTQQRIDCAKE